MRLANIQVDNFRSVRSATLEDLGDFNVLIGRNNAGKSAMLEAVNLFFDCLSAQGLVNTAPPIRNMYDYHNGNTTKPINIIVRVDLDLAERDTLVREIVQEYPQVQNAVEGISPKLSALAALVISADRGINTSHISSIALLPQSSFSTENVQFLLELPPSAAQEMAERARATVELSEKLRVLRLSIRLFDRFSGTDVSQDPRFLIEYAASEIPGTSRDAVRRYLTPIQRKSSDIETFKANAEAAIISTETEFAKAESLPIRSTVRTFAGETTEVPNHVSGFLNRLAKLKVHYLTEARRQIGRVEAQRLLDLKVSRGGPEVLQRIQQTVSGLLGVRIDAFRPTAADRGAPPKEGAELDVDNFLVEVNGSGIREALRVMLDMEFNEPDVLLIEEPEVHLHPALEIALMRYLKAVGPSTQVVIATHSTNFLDMGDMSSVYLVRKNNSTSVSRLTIDDAEVEIPRELGIRLSSLFMFDRLVFVEGPSDELILRELATKLGINLSQKNIGFVTLGGISNFAHYAAKATLDFLSKRRVDSHFVVDRDERLDADVQTLRDLLGDRAQLHALGRRELENYLLSASAIVTVIRDRSQDESPVTEEEISAKIDEIVDGLKEYAIELRVSRQLCAPVYLRGRSSSVSGSSQTELAARLNEAVEKLQDRARILEEEFNQQRRLVNAEWATSRMDVVPGSVVLDKLLADWGIRYQKDRDGAAIARALDADSIPQDLVNILKAIAEDK